MLKDAFNALVNIHSRDAQLLRLGTVNIYSPCRIMPSQYFRYQRGPEATVIHGREFVIPIDSLQGQFAQTIAFADAPASGTFKLSYNSNDTTALQWNASASTIQTALRLLAGLSNVIVTGTIAAGLVVSFPGFATVPLAITATDHATLEDADSDAVEITIANSFAAWDAPIIKRGDKVQDSVYGRLTITEIEEMVDLGAAIMGFRIRVED